MENKLQIKYKIERFKLTICSKITQINCVLKNKNFTFDSAKQKYTIHIKILRMCCLKKKNVLLKINEGFCHCFMARQIKSNILS